jgi:DNA replication ATP-dependent helicase Dna2
MPPTSHNAKDEDSFMADLLEGLDDSFWNAVPTPDPSPIKPAPSRHPITSQPKKPLSKLKFSPKPLTSRAALPSPSKVFSAGDVDISALLEGAEDWDWDDMNSDLLTPKKDSPRKAVKVRS